MSLPASIITTDDITGRAAGAGSPDVALGPRGNCRRSYRSVVTVPASQVVHHNCTATCYRVNHGISQAEHKCALFTCSAVACLSHQSNRSDSLGCMVVVSWEARPRYEHCKGSLKRELSWRRDRLGAAMCYHTISNKQRSRTQVVVSLRRRGAGSVRRQGKEWRYLLGLMTSFFANASRL